MQPELAAVLAHMPDEQCCRVGGRDFWVGHWHGCPVVAVLSRVGKVAAATTATALIERFGVQAIVFTGVAGGLARGGVAGVGSGGVRVGDVVVAHSFVQHDMDASPLFPRFEVPLYGRACFGTDAGLSAQLADAARRVLADPRQALGQQAVDEFALYAPQVHTGLVASGDRFVSSSSDGDRLRTALPEALAVEMEGAAIAQVCHDYGLPFAAMRTISDCADEAAHVDFARFIDAVASQYSQAVLDEFFRAGGG